MVIMKICFRVGGSCWVWFWLAMSIRGNSQQDRTSKGEDIESIPVHWVKFLLGK